MNEAETRAEHIDPALKAAGWSVPRAASSGASIRLRPAGNGSSSSKHPFPRPRPHRGMGERLIINFES